MKQQSKRSWEREASERLPSTAWLEAQAAFSASRPALNTSPSPVVLVRRGRAIPTMPGSSAIAQVLASPNAGPAEIRAARVFLVAATPALHGSSELEGSLSMVRPATGTMAVTRKAARQSRGGSKSAAVTVQRFAPLPAEASPVSHLEQIKQLRQLMEEAAELLNDALKARALRFVC